MTVGIIIRPSGYSSKKQAPVFKPHFNRSIPSPKNPEGTYFRTKEDYYGTLKKKGLEPYDPTAKDSGKRAPYVASEKTRKIVQSISEHTRKGKFKPSGKLLSAMESVGVKMTQTQSDLAKLPAHYQKGGFHDV